MSTQDTTETKTQTQTKTDEATHWLKPDQIESMRNATVENSAEYLSTRNNVLIRLMADTGLRVNETRQLDTSMIEWDDKVLKVPARIQKDYPNENSPSTTSIGLDNETVRNLRTFLNTRWKDPDALFPSRQNERISNQSIRDMIRNAAQAAEVRPHTDEGRGSPDDVTPHTLRHSVAYRMIRREGKTIYDVRNRLRHSSLVTTVKFYGHFDVV